MKLALITAPKGFHIVDYHRLSYHLVLAQYVLEGFKYGEYYRTRHDSGDFIMLDNGAAEEGTLSIEKLLEAAKMVHADEIVLPDVMGDSTATITATMNPEVLAAIPPRRRAVVPQGNSIDEWFTCANCFVDELEFATMCVPKHLERFEGGRIRVLELIEKLHWNDYYNIHLLGVWGDPYREPKHLNIVAPWARGIDTAAPLALAQNNLTLEDGMLHVSHSWTKSFPRAVAIRNVETMLHLVGGYA